MGKPAARLTDPTAHGGLIVGPGVPTVLIGKMPAATMGDNHVCPMVTPSVPPIPHVGGPITLGSTGVFIGKKPAARMGDMAVCVGPPSSIIMGCPTVLIGEAGSGSQAGSAGAAAAAGTATVTSPKKIEAIKIKAEEAKTQEAHQVELTFLDDSGKPVSGIPFVLKDPDGAEIVAASNAEGGFIKGGYSKKGSFEVAVLSLSDAAWSGSPKDGGELTMKCKAPNSKDGTGATFQIDALTESGQIFTLATVGAKAQGDAVEAKWTYRDILLDPVRQQSKSEVKSLQFLVHSGALAAISPVLDLEAGKGKYGSAVRAKLKGVWFQEGSDQILPEKASLLRLVSRYLAVRGSLKGNIILGKVGPESEGTPDAALTLKRGQILASLLMGYSDLFLKKFGNKEWGDKEAQGFLGGLHAKDGSHFYTGPTTGSWSEEGAAELRGFQRSHGMMEKDSVDARFGSTVFDLLHDAAGKPKAGQIIPLVSDSVPKLPEKVTLELYFWIRGKSPKLAEYKESAQSVRDEMDKCVVQELGGEGGGWSR